MESKEEEEEEEEGVSVERKGVRPRSINLLRTSSSLSNLLLVTTRPHVQAKSRWQSG